MHDNLETRDLELETTFDLFRVRPSRVSEFLEMRTLKKLARDRSILCMAKLNLNFRGRVKEGRPYCFCLSRSSFTFEDRTTWYRHSVRCEFLTVPVNLKPESSKAKVPH